MSDTVENVETVGESLRSVLGGIQKSAVTFAGNVQLIAGGSDDVTAVLAYLARAGIETESNPDLYVRHYRQFGIDDAQELRARVATRALGDRRVFVVSTGGMTSEAQNALLKTLEDPPGNALFIFIVPAPDALLATVRSRAQIVEIEHAGTPRKESVLDAAVFLGSPVSKRLDLLKIILEKDADDKYDTGGILTFLADLERHVAHEKDESKKHEALNAIFRARAYMTDRGALVKTLLESVALLAPVV